MGALAGLVLGCGLLLTWSAWWPPGPRGPASRFTLAWQDAAAQAGAHGLDLRALAAGCIAAGGIVTLASVGLGTAISVAVAFGAIASALPVVYLRARVRRRRVELRTLWPDVVDDLASAVRAGLPLPEALVALAERGPLPLRGDMAAFAAEYRATGRFSEALGAWQQRLADPVADRLAATLRLATEVGGSDLGRMLRTLSDFLRQDLRTRGELEARQSWTVNGARLAVAAPWLVLALMSGRGQSATSFDTPGGITVLTVGAAVSVLAYAVMLRIGRLPEEPRVLRSSA